jgi:perosamine synthetase
VQIDRLRDVLDHHVPTLAFARGTDVPVWREKVRSEVARMAAVDARQTLLAGPARTSWQNGLRYELREFKSESRQRIRAAFLSSESSEDSWAGAAVLVSPGLNAKFEQVVGLEPADYPDRDVAARLARAGFMTLTLDYGIMGEAGKLSAAMSLYGRSLLAALVQDASGALAWLSNDPRTDENRIGLFGHSLGAAVSLHTALLSPRLTAVCAASHLGTYPEMFGRLFTGSQAAILPGILCYADLPDLYAALAPAPLQLQYGIRDTYLSDSDAAAAAQAISEAYTAVRAQARLEILRRDMGHGTDVGAAIGFFRRELGHSLAGPTAAPQR